MKGKEKYNEIHRFFASLMLVALAISPSSATTLSSDEPTTPASEVVKEADNVSPFAASDAKPMTLEQFNEQRKALKTKYGCGPISSKIDTTLDDSDQFISAAFKQQPNKVEVVDWYRQTNMALVSARRNEAAEAIRRLEIAQAVHDTNKGRSSSTLLADVYLLNAFFKKLQGRYQESLNDLQKLYELHKNEPQTWCADSRFFAEFDSSRQRPPSYEELKAGEIVGQQNEMHAMNHEDFKNLEFAVLKNLDQRCLSNRKCRVLYSVFYSDQGFPVYKKVIGENDTAADDFYCEQAIWEYAIPVHARGKQMVYEFIGHPNAKYGEHPELLTDETIRRFRKDWIENQSEDQPVVEKPGFVTLHLLPLHFRWAELDFPVGVLSTRENVLKLRTDKLNDPALKQFRMEWFDFSVKVPITPQTLMERANIIRHKYAKLFS